MVFGVGNGDVRILKLINLNRFVASLTPKFTKKAQNSTLNKSQPIDCYNSKRWEEQDTVWQLIVIVIFLYDLNIFNLLKDDERVILQSHLFKILGLSDVTKGSKAYEFQNYDIPIGYPTRKYRPVLIYGTTQSFYRM